MKNGFILFSLVIVTYLMSCSEPLIDGRIDLDMFDEIEMRVINDSDIDLMQVTLVPCFNPSDNLFFNVNSSDTTEYRFFDCGFYQTIVEVITNSDTLKHEPIDFSSPLSAGSYDCVINISEDQNLDIQIQQSEI